MPSTFQRLAVDLDGDGRRDIVDSVPDARRFDREFPAGRQAGYAALPWGYEVRIPDELQQRARAGARTGARSRAGRRSASRASTDARCQAITPPACSCPPAARRPGLSRDEELRRALFLQRRRILRSCHRGPVGPPARRPWRPSRVADRRPAPLARRAPRVAAASRRRAATMSASRTARSARRPATPSRSVEQQIGIAPTGRPGGKVLQALRGR